MQKNHNNLENNIGSEVQPEKKSSQLNKNLAKAALAILVVAGTAFLHRKLKVAKSF